MENNTELTEEEYKKIRKSRTREKKMKRKDSGDLSKVGEYLGPWSGYEGIEEDKFFKINFSKFNRIVNKNCSDIKNEKIFHFGEIKIEKNSKLMKTEFSYPNQNNRLLKSHKSAITKIKYLEQYDILLSSGLDGKINFYKMTENSGCIRTIYGHSKGVSYFDSKGVLLCSGSYDGHFKTYNLLSGKTYNRYDVKNLITSGCQDLDENVINLGGARKSVNVIDCRCKDTVTSYYLDGNNGNLEKSYISSINNINEYKDCINKIEVVDENMLGISLYSKDFFLYDKRNEKVLYKKSNINSFITINDKILLLENNQLYLLCDNKIYDIKYKMNNRSGDIFLSYDKSTLYYSDRDRNVIFLPIFDEEENFMRFFESKILYNHKEEITYLHLKNYDSSCLYIGDTKGNIQERIYKK